VFASALTSAANAGEQAPDFDYMAQMLLDAREARRPFPAFARINPALTDPQLFDIQRHYIRKRLQQGAEIGGYKGGFIAQAPVGGVLFKAGMIDAEADVARGDFVALLVEAEIAFRFCQRVTEPLTSVDELREQVCEIAPAVELPDGAFADLGILKKDFALFRRVLIPTNISAAGLLLGAARSPAGLDVDRLPVVAKLDGAEIGRRNIETSSDMWQKVLWVVNDYVLKQGYTIERGHVVIPGNLTGIHIGTTGHYEIEFGDLGKIAFRVVE
jgi:2-keto-4-pentenoate hydratase